jgi:dihydropteroate synthase
MGIINVTPDSFYEASRVQEQSVLRERVRQILDEGGAIIDVGAYSTRPGALDISAEAEMERLRWALPIVVDEAEKWYDEHNGNGPKPLISVDTFRAAVAEMCVTELGADIINDISGGTLDEEMFDIVARTRTIYILMHSRGTPQDMQQRTDYADGVVDEVIRFFKVQVGKLVERFERFEKFEQFEKFERLENVVLDPGFGFAKTLEQNYALMKGLDRIREALPDYPLLVGVSRKSMVYKLLGTDALHALNGTTVLNTYALLHGASILRVHDVKEAVEAIKICGNLAQKT